jgi:hypothetical protein
MNPRMLGEELDEYLGPKGGLIDIEIRLGDTWSAAQLSGRLEYILR